MKDASEILSLNTSMSLMETFSRQLIDKCICQCLKTDTFLTQLSDECTDGSLNTLRHFYTWCPINIFIVLTHGDTSNLERLMTSISIVLFH